MSDLSSLLDQSSYLRLISDTSKHNELATSTKMSTHKEYVSCIRIKGRPILPPVMTPERKLECIEWKRKALEVEEKLGLKRREKILAAIKTLKVTTSSASTDINSRPSSAPVPSVDVQNSIENSSVMAENVCNADSANIEQIRDSEDNPATNMSSLDRTLECTSDANKITLDSITSNEGEVQIEESHQKISNIGESKIQVKDKISSENINNCVNEYGFEKDNGTSNTNTNSESVQKRERRGSYTLDEPSPLLLAYMERFGQNFDEKNDLIKSNGMENDARKTSDHLNTYLTQLSQPPEAKFSPEMSNRANDISDDTNGSDIVSESKTKDDINIDKLVIDEQKCPTTNMSMSEKDYEPITHKKEYSEEKSVENLKTPDNATNLTFLKNDEQSINSKNSLSSQIRKLSNFVQNEAEIVQRQVHLIEENRSAARKEQKYQTMHIQIPNSPGVKPVENSENMLTIHNLQSPLVSPNVSSLASSLQESMSIRVPSSRGPKEENKPISTNYNIRHSPLQERFETNETIEEVTNTSDIQLTPNSKSLSSNRVKSRETMEMAVSSLAKAQQAEIQKLMQQQEKERTALKSLFEQQQKRLIQELLTHFNSRSPTPSSASSTTLEAESASSAIVRTKFQKPLSTNSNDNSKSLDQLTPTNYEHPKRKNKSLHSVSYASTNTSISKEMLDTESVSLKSPHIRRSLSPVVPALPMYLRPESRILPSNYQIPSEVFTNERYHQGFCMLSAMVKGFLIRRLMKTERVQRIIGSMRDTMTIALQLHREAKQVNTSHLAQNASLNGTPTKRVTMQDVELHRRLLQQLFKDSQEFHNIFFKLTTIQRMNIIKLDNEKKEGRSRLSDISPKVLSNNPGDFAKPKRLSSATKARIEQKQLIQQMLLKTASNSPRPRSTLKPNRNVISASSAISSPRRDGKNRVTERSKSATPRSARQRLCNGKKYS